MSSSSSPKSALDAPLDAVIVSVCRTAIKRRSSDPPVSSTMLSTVIDSTLCRVPGLSASDVEDVCVGNVLGGEGVRGAKDEGWSEERSDDQRFDDHRFLRLWNIFNVQYRYFRT